MLLDTLITEDIQRRAELEAASELMRFQTPFPVVRLEFDIMRQTHRVWCGEHTQPLFEISAELLYQTALPIARRIAQKEGGLIANKLHAADVVREVRENPTGRTTDELIEDAQAAVECRDQDAALRAIAELMKPS